MVSLKVQEEIVVRHAGLALENVTLVQVAVHALGVTLLVPDQKSVVLVPDQAAQDPMVLAALVQEYVLRQAFRSES